VYSRSSVATTLIRRDDVDVKSVSLLHLEMILSGISHGNIVAFPNAADVHVFRSAVFYCQHPITTLEKIVQWEDLLVLLDHDYFRTSGEGIAEDDAALLYGRQLQHVLHRKLKNTHETKTEMDCRWCWLELFRRLSIFDHADDIPRHHAGLLSARSGSFV
jgi:hypothetical protein